MKKSSNTNIDDIVKMLIENEMGIVLLERDRDNKSLFDILTKNSNYQEKLGLYGGGHHITYHLYPVMYNGKDEKITQDQVECRANALNNIFTRWSSLGYNKRHSKSSFNSKEFNKYLENINFLKADYMLLMVE